MCFNICIYAEEEGQQAETSLRSLQVQIGSGILGIFMNPCQESFAVVNFPTVNECNPVAIIIDTWS